MSEPAAFKYRAFISYSHADTGWAKWLQRGLESFKIGEDLAGRETARGTIPETLRPIFRDREDFTAGETLPEQTLAALDASVALIVICSPAAAKSHYVNEEMRAFKSRHPKRPVIPLIVDGKPGDPEHECFPPALKVKLDAKGRITKKRVELLAADARDEGDGKDLALAKVIAGLIGLSSDEVFRRAERERRLVTRRRRRVQALIGGLAILLLVGSIGWLKQDYLRERLHWYSEMSPDILTAAQERALKPGEDFADCRRGCPTMVVIPAGEFMMGSPVNTGNIDERPRHKVVIARPLAVGRFEVTLGELQFCIDAGACDPDIASGHFEQPAVERTWNQAQQFVAWLSRSTGKHYRLLSESEWEYAARAGTTTLYSFGDEESALDKYASRGRVRLVGQRDPNNFNLYDMHGSAAEWVEDCYHQVQRRAVGRLAMDGPVQLSGDTRRFLGRPA